MRDSFSSPLDSVSIPIRSIPFPLALHSSRNGRVRPSQKTLSQDKSKKITRMKNIRRNQLNSLDFELTEGMEVESGGKGLGPKDIAASPVMAGTVAGVDNVSRNDFFETEL